MRRGSLIAVLGLSLLANTAFAETLTEALISAYANNSVLNAARATVRAVDENVPIARASGLPSVSGSGSYTLQNTSAGTSADTGSSSVSITQNLFRGFRTRNEVLSAEAGIMAARANLNSTEQSVLLSAAQAYMDVIQNSRIVQLRNSNLEFLSFEVRAAQDRFEVGDSTRTDIALAEGALQSGRADLFTAQANLDAAIGVYRQVVGVPPRGLRTSDPFEPFLPVSIEAALEIAFREHPSIMQAQYEVDQQMRRVKSTEGRLLPTLSVTGTFARNWNQSGSTTNSATFQGNVSVPIFQGGAVYGAVRQEKENLGRARINVDTVRDQVRADVATAWGSLLSGRSAIKAATAQVKARQLAVAGVVEERRVGQATTLDVLDVQSDLISAQVTLAQAERNLVVAGASMLAAIGRLNTGVMQLPVTRYNPADHATQVRGKLVGTRTPDGR